MGQQQSGSLLQLRNYAWVVAILLALLPVTSGLTLNLCSTTNLAGDSSPSNSIYMSNGLCQNTCLNQGKGVAILSGTNCYCTDNVPADTVDLSKCAIGCPGYKDQENCAGNGYFGYLIINGPSSTVTKQSPTPSTAPSTNKKTQPTDNNQPSNEPSSDQPSADQPGTTMITQTTEITQTQQDSDIVKVTTTVSKVNSDSSQASMQPSTVFSYVTINGTLSQEIKTLYITQVTAETSSTDPSDSLAVSSNVNDREGAPTTTSDTDAKEKADQNKSTFFDDTAKVAGTFTAVGVVVLGLVSGILYCCCAGSRNHHNGDYTDEESQSSGDELSIDHEKQAGTQLSTPSHSVKRNSSHKSVFKLFTGEKDSVNRSSSRKKLMSKNSPNPNIPEDANASAGGSIIMFPINEVDARLDPYTMFLNTNLSKQSLGDEKDYSRKLKIINPEISAKEV
ncbi:uncharacterized protein SPAPADRAFT_138656 [Spathaspora passalidarum NRRL Y-27907]|uniref:WSC domain-containing protein n=1 Tax=Spathaspora passalidarum (strain NRRL Y-27907 / 11-Y1) TaxID=619300 RepID=G3ANZ7_SPAPN|nr:uncharacterized protein SPAPADRAFT_138656 [Spathaspora passalidarum NRRL Y-27907]EGW32622.1 hypothetical protein SPAPADRAFT_138656 [Spathaspora passalidarum NRRL Y-27907]